MTWVADASPLLFLAKLERLGLLAHSGDVLSVPPLSEALRRLFWRSEILQVMYWLRGEGLCPEASPADIAKVASKKAPAKKSPAKKSTAKKAPAKKSTAKKTAKKS